MSDQSSQDQNEPRSHFITRLQTLERQVGENVLAALESEGCVAVLTTVVSGLRADRVVSVPLDGEQAKDVSAVLAEAQVDPDESDQDEPLIGFHVVLKNDEPDDA
ncbi:MAG: hypothetical protein VX727_04840 [Planctomycetota bacterium]|nr:hypothetical protein [Planctomycetota bacterium]|tara:strand:- start:24767 stop:25081 length:315 start_codon:yes stop_codon:yes gene_type:complete